MNYFLIFIFTALLNVYSSSNNRQTRVEVTFESASLVHNHSKQGHWSYSATVNNLKIKQGKTLVLRTKSDNAVTFMVSASNENAGNVLENLRGTGSVHQGKMIINLLSLKNPSVIYTYSASNVTMDMHELMQKKPKELNMFVTYNKNASPTEVVGKSTSLVFQFRLKYE